MKLLFFIHSLGGGGAERVTANLANYWASKSWDITVVTLESQGEDFYILDPAVKRIALELAGRSDNGVQGLLRNAHRVIALRRILRRVAPDIAIGMMTTANVILALSALGLPKVRAIGSERIHPPQFFLGSIWHWLRRHCYARLAAVVALTGESAEWLRRHTSARRVLIIPNAPTWPILRQASALTLEPPRPSGRRILLAVGRLSGQKQFDVLIGAFAKLAEQYHDWDLIILGDGPLRHALLEQAGADGLEKRVFLPGKAGNVADWYKSADLYVMSSRFEGFPNTLVEAMAHGVPAISFDCDTGPRDIIRHEIDGLLVPAGDVPGLLSALDRLMGDHMLRQSLAKRAIEVRDRFSMERIARLWEDLFQRVIK